MNKKKKKKDKTDGGTDSWPLGGRREKRQGRTRRAPAPHVHFHSLEVILRRYLFNFSV